MKKELIKKLARIVLNLSVCAFCFFAVRKELARQYQNGLKDGAGSMLDFVIESDIVTEQIVVEGGATLSDCRIMVLSIDGAKQPTGVMIAPYKDCGCYIESSSLRQTLISNNIFDFRDLGSWDL